MEQKIHRIFWPIVSFFNKNITTTEGGMLTTNDKKRYEEIKRLIAHGINKDKKKFYWNESQIYRS